MIVVTHCDADNLDSERVVDDLEAAVGDLCRPFDHPDVNGPGFDAESTIFEVDHHDERRNLLERIMDAGEDEVLLARCLETGAWSGEELQAQIPRAISRGSLLPIRACNRLTGTGVDAVCAFLAQFCPTPEMFVQRAASWSSSGGSRERLEVLSASARAVSVAAAHGPKSPP